MGDSQDHVIDILYTLGQTSQIQMQGILQSRKHLMRIVLPHAQAVYTQFTWSMFVNPFWCHGQEEASFPSLLAG